MALSPQDWQRAADVYAGRIPPVTGMDVQPMPQPPGAMMQQPEVLMPDSMQGMPASAPEPMPMRGAMPLSYDGLAQQVDQSAAEQMDSVQRQAAIRAQGSANQANIQAQQAAVAAQRARNAEQQRRDYAAHVADLEQRGAQLDNEIASSRYEDKRTTGQRIGALIGLAFAGIGDAFSGFAGRQTDYVGQTQQLIDSMVEADKQRWREQLQNKKDARSANQNALARARQFFQDDRAADEYVGALQKEYWAGQLEAEALRMGNQLVQEQATTAAAKIKQDAAETKLKIMSEAADNTFRDKQLALQRARMGGGGRRGFDWGTLTRPQLEQLESEGRLPADGALVLKSLRSGDPKAAQEAKPKALTDGQQKAMRLYQGADAAATQVAKSLDSLDSKKSTDVPGAGWVAGWLPDAMTSSEGVAFRNGIRKMVQTMLRDESGAAISDKEVDQFLQARGWSDTGNNTDNLQAAKSILAEFQLKQRAVGVVPGSTAPGIDEVPKMPIMRSPSDYMYGVPAGGKPYKVYGTKVVK